MVVQPTDPSPRQLPPPVATGPVIPPLPGEGLCNDQTPPASITPDCHPLVNQPCLSLPHCPGHCCPCSCHPDTTRHHPRPLPDLPSEGSPHCASPALLAPPPWQAGTPAPAAPLPPSRTAPAGAPHSDPPARLAPATPCSQAVEGPLLLLWKAACQRLPAAVHLLAKSQEVCCWLVGPAVAGPGAEWGLLQRPHALQPRQRPLQQQAGRAQQPVIQAGEDSLQPVLSSAVAAAWPPSAAAPAAAAPLPQPVVGALPHLLWPALWPQPCSWVLFFRGCHHPLPRQQSGCAGGSAPSAARAAVAVLLCWLRPGLDAEAGEGPRGHPGAAPPAGYAPAPLPLQSCCSTLGAARPPWRWWAAGGLGAAMPLCVAAVLMPVPPLLLLLLLL